MNYEVTEGAPLMVEEEVRDLRGRTKEFALRVVKMYAALPKTTEAQVFGKQVMRSGTSTTTSNRNQNRLSAGSSVA